MKKLFLLLVFAPLICFGQMPSPVKWTASVSKSEVKEGETIELIVKASIDNGWKLYSFGDPEPPHISFSFEENDSYKLVGKPSELKPAKSGYDSLLEMNVNYFEKAAEYRQKIKILKDNPQISLDIDAQACQIGQCVPVRKTLSVGNIKMLPATKEKPDKQGNNLKSDTDSKKPKQDSLKAVAKADSTKDSIATSGNISNPTIDNKLIEKVGDKIQTEDISLLAFVLLCFGAGLLSLLTPCVFPMIPLTVTFFTNSAGGSKGQAVKKALIYGFSIILIFTIIGVTTGPFLANLISTHWIPNLIFFVIFLIFGLSFLGLFEITLSSSFVNKVDAQSEKGGLYGVFFMALTLVLVSFSCTVPIVGTVLVEASGGKLIKPVLGMLSFSIAFAIPFTTFALFPELLKKLPKSGGWLNVIKVVLGFLELALSLKFLSMIDQVYHLRILDREVFIAIWIVVFILMGYYLLGKLKLPHDSDVEKISVPRLIVAIVPLVFAVYLIPGMFGAPLRALSGYLPPMYTHDFDISKIIRENNTGQDHTTLCSEPKYSATQHLPHGLKVYFTYEEALKCAKEKNLPLFLDFTGHACTNCRQVEANVWSDPEILKTLSNDYVVASLYMDDRTPLPKEEQYISKVDGGKVKTLGAKNTDFAVSRFGTAAQPYYILIDPHTEKMLVNPPLDFELSTVTYLNYLNQGLENYKKLHP